MIFPLGAFYTYYYAQPEVKKTNYYKILWLYSRTKMRIVLLLCFCSVIPTLKRTEKNKTKYNNLLENYKLSLPYCCASI